MQRTTRSCACIVSRERRLTGGGSDSAAEKASGPRAFKMPSPGWLRNNQKLREPVLCSGALRKPEHLAGEEVEGAIWRQAPDHRDRPGALARGIVRSRAIRRP